MSVNPLLSESRVGLDSHDQVGTGEPQIGEAGVAEDRALGNREVVRLVVSVPSGWRDERDFYVLCSCGWCSLPKVEAPTVTDCEACDTLNDGLTGREYFMGHAGKRGYQVESEVIVKRQERLK